MPSNKYLNKIISYSFFFVASSSFSQVEVQDAVTIRSATSTGAGYELASAEKELEVMSIRGSSGINAIEDSGFNVDVISTQEYLNTTKNITQLLNETPGIVVRENGGLGSEFDLSLNGLSGDQVRYFIDGVPMENFGSALGLNNIPVNLVQRVEVFKGVVPISLGSDALAGAINIITPGLDEEIFDASYSYGSFNTHRIALLGQTSSTDGYFLRASGYFNYSDNNYIVEDVPVTDDNDNIVGEISAERFNDQYKSSMLSMKMGQTNLSWADELSLSLTYAQNKDNEQHPSSSINLIFGERYSRNETYLLSGLYEKQLERLFIKSYVLAGSITETYYDTANRSYDWQGNYTDKSTVTQGEYERLSIFKLEDKVLRLNLSADFAYSEDTTFSLNISTNKLERDGDDRIDTVDINFTLPNSVEKNVIAFNYSKLLFKETLNLNLFVKEYDYSARIGSQQDIDGVVQDDDARVKLSNTGYGFSLRYQLSQASRINTSYERAYRLPEPDEILGSGQFIRANPDLTAEVSDNFNVGFISQLKYFDLYMKGEINGFYRNADDFISFEFDRVITGTYKNTSRVEVTGIESALSFNWNEIFDLKINGTYQDIIDKAKFLDNGGSNSGYGNRLPNKPHLYANLRSGFNYVTSDYNKFSLHWSSHYVERYFLNSEADGDKEFNRDIPMQLTHDINLEYSMNYGTYNIAFNAINIFDEQVYDNHNIQKPGRAFYLKFRYSH